MLFSFCILGDRWNSPLVDGKCALFHVFLCCILCCVTVKKQRFDVRAVTYTTNINGKKISANARNYSNQESKVTWIERLESAKKRNIKKKKMKEDRVIAFTNSIGKYRKFGHGLGSGLQLPLLLIYLCQCKACFSFLNQKDFAKSFSASFPVGFHKHCLPHRTWSRLTIWSIRARYMR